MNELQEGAQLHEIGFPNGEVISDQSAGVHRIIVSMQPGQMGLVPWARAETDTKTQLINLASVEYIVLQEATDDAE